jgi:hypothetical protein
MALESYHGYKVRPLNYSFHCRGEWQNSEPILAQAALLYLKWFCCLGIICSL